MGTNILSSKAKENNMIGVIFISIICALINVITIYACIRVGDD